MGLGQSQGTQLGEAAPSGDVLFPLSSSISTPRHAAFTAQAWSRCTALILALSLLPHRCLCIERRHQGTWHLRDTQMISASSHPLLSLQRNIGSPVPVFGNWAVYWGDKMQLSNRAQRPCSEGAAMAGASCGTGGHTWWLLGGSDRTQERAELQLGAMTAPGTSAPCKAPLPAGTCSKTAVGKLPAPEKPQPVSSAEGMQPLLLALVEILQEGEGRGQARG